MSSWGSLSRRSGRAAASAAGWTLRASGPLARRPLAAPGLLGAEIASWAAFTPSLIPRPWPSTAMTTFSAQVSGHVVGMAAGVAARAAGRRLFPRAARAARRRPRARDAVTLAAHAAMSAVTVGVWLRSIGHQRTIAALVGYDELASARAQLGGTAAGTAAFLATRAAAVGVERVHGGLTGLLRRRLPRGLAPAAAGALVAAALAPPLDLLVVRRAIGRVSRRAARLNMRVLPGRVQPWEPSRSGSPWSLEPWHALGAQGRAFVADGPRARDIAAVVGADPRDVREPIRLYAGRVPGRTLAAQTELIIRELHRTGAFRRGHLVVHTSTGTGWVPEWAPAAVEFLTRGDCAQVSLQYSDLPSPVAWLTDRESPLAAGAALFDRVREEWARLPADARPMLIAAGESLGAIGGQGAFADPADLLARVDGAVWAGSPPYAPIRRELTRRRDPGSPEIAPVVDGGAHHRFATRPEELWESIDGEALGHWARPRVAWLQHASDPIVWCETPLAWRRPDWLRERRGRDVIAAMRWWPLITFWQVLVDGLTSVAVGDGHGHRYEEEMLPAFAAVLGAEFDADRGGAAGVRFARAARWIRRNSVG